MEQSTQLIDRTDALALLYSRIDYERTTNVPYSAEEFKLDRMRDLLSQLGDPQQGMKIVHVAGTKGKGSTASMIGAVLSAAGYRTGLYTSPHLDRVEQRLSVDGCPCSSSELVELLMSIQPVVETMDEEVRRGTRRRGPTFFEMTTAMALLHFARRNVDIAVLEVGLGGRLDSTNICSPLVSVITSVSFDHTKQLGNTLESIATEKAGIIKPGVPVVSGVTMAEPRDVITTTAKENDCPLFTAGQEFDFQYELKEPHSAGTSGTEQSMQRHGTMHYWDLTNGSTQRLNDVQLGLLGRHQASNAAVAMATLKQLDEQGWIIPEAAIRTGLFEVQCPARVEVLSERPTIVIDAAHNLASVKALVRTLRENFTVKCHSLIFATSQDKDAQAMLVELLPCFERVILTRYVNNPRYVSPEQLFEVANRAIRSFDQRARPQTEILVAPDPSSAWQQVVTHLSPHHLVCVAGSSFIASEIRPLALKSLELQVVG